ncbi:DMT family transporter [Neobacillus drentensis]|uniref:DMT family transporter n=1 Tax=Neobacillus drentensis TaxID=220684 RepID=UPI003001BA10
MTLAYLLLILVNFCYAIPLVISQVALEQIPIFLFIEISFIAAFVILFPLSMMKEKVKWNKLGRKNYGMLFVQGLLINVLLNIFLLFGISHTSATATGIINSSTPAVILILSFLILRERINLLSTIAILMAVAGVALQSFISLGDSPKVSLIGNFSVLLAVLSQSFFVVYSKKYAAEVPPITTATIVMLVGVILFIPFAVMDMQNFNWGAVSASNWWIDIIYGVVGNALALIFYYIAIKRVPAKTVGIFGCLLPIITTVTAVLALGEPFTIILIVSLCSILLSVVIAVLADRNKESEVTSAEPMDELQVKL